MAAGDGRAQQRAAWRTAGGTTHAGEVRADVVRTGLALSVTCLALAPVLLPVTYSWVAHTTSESAAQGVSGAWLARLGFLLFGASVVVLVERPPLVWPALARPLHLGFALLMVAVAVFSSRPWMPGAARPSTPPRTCCTPWRPPAWASPSRPACSSSGSGASVRAAG